MNLRMPAEIDGISEERKKIERNISGRKVVVNTMRPHSAPMDGEHLVSSVALKGGSARNLWAFQPTRMKKTLVRLREDQDNNLYIIMDSFGINEVIPVASLVSGKKMAPGELLELKAKVAWAMNSSPRYTEEERVILNAIERVEKEKEAAAMQAIKAKQKAEEEAEAKRKAEITAKARAERKAKEAEIMSKKAKRLRKRSEILSREAVTVCNSLGYRFTGKPVTGDEWKVLEDGSRVVSVDPVSVDSHGIKTGRPLEAFTVEKKGGGECRRVKILTNLRFVGDKIGMKAESHDLHVKSRSNALVDIEGNVIELPHYPSLKEYKSGSEKAELVAIGKKTKDDKIMVFRMERGDFSPIGIFPAISEAVIVN